MFRVDAGALRLTTDRAAVFLGRRSKGFPSDDSSKGGTSRVIDAIPGSVQDCPRPKQPVMCTEDVKRALSVLEGQLENGSYSS